MKRFGVLTLLFGLIAFGAVAILWQPADALAAEACGEKGQKPCPLQGWMETNIDVPFEKKDFKKLEVAFTQLAKMSPDPKWNEGENGWSKIAEQGAAAAKAGDFGVVRGTCKSCHKAWRKQYRTEHRLKPVK